MQIYKAPPRKFGPPQKFFDRDLKKKKFFK